MNANCTNTVGGHNCTCKEGFAGDGRSCSGKQDFRLRWLNRVMQDHEARASDLNGKLIFSFFLLFS